MCFASISCSLANGGLSYHLKGTKDLKTGPLNPTNAGASSLSEDRTKEVLGNRLIKKVVMQGQVERNKERALIELYQEEGPYADSLFIEVMITNR